MREQLAGVLLLALGLTACAGPGMAARVAAGGATASGSAAQRSTPTAPAAASGTPAPALPPAVAALLPANATVLAAQQASLRDDGSTQWVVLFRLPGPSGANASYPPPSTTLAILQDAPGGWAVVKAVNQGFVLGAQIHLVPIAGRQAVVMEYGSGAHNGGVLILRYDGILDYSVVYDGTSDAGMVVKDLQNNGEAEVLRTWSPGCGSFVASPKITTAYAWQNGRFVEATRTFPEVLAKDTAAFQGALARSGAGAPPADRACLHAALAFLAGEAGKTAEAATQEQAARQADSSYDVRRVADLAAGLPVRAGRS